MENRGKGNSSGLIMDHPAISSLMFHPRKDCGGTPPQGCMISEVETDDGIHIGIRSYFGFKDYPHVLFFHGNGEIAEDYDDIAPIYHQFGLAVTIADYRGYGRSQGKPSASKMLEDAHAIFHFLMNRLEQTQHKVPFWIMGRSLGSASACELVSFYPDQINGLIIESGFAQTIPLLQRIGIDTAGLGLKEKDLFSNNDKIKVYQGPTLIIHAEFDQIIPMSHGKDLYQASPAGKKQLQIIPGADHNTLMVQAGMRYFELIAGFIKG